DVEIADVPEHGAELLEPRVELRRARREEIPPGAEEGAQAADADAHVVEALRIAPQPRPRIVPLDLSQLLAQAALQRLERRRGVRLLARLEVEGAEELRQAVAFLRTRLGDLLCEGVEPAGAARPQLELELDEPVP